MCYELAVLLFTYKEIPVHYFGRLLFKRRIKNFKDFLPNKFSGRITCLFNDNREKDVLDNKLSFDLFYRQYNLNLPNILMYNDKNLFVTGINKLEINNINEFVRLLKGVFNNGLSRDSVIIKKTVASSSGKSIYKLFRDQIDAGDNALKDVYSEVIKSEFLFQETIRQHPELNRLSSSSLNTLRIDTFIDRDGKIDIISGLLRMSINNTHIDNITLGGCQVGIVLETGKLKKYGFSNIKLTGLKELTRHPITHTVFENFRVPFFSEAKELVLRAAAFKPSMRLVGWDVAITESGPVIIEGNFDYAIAGNDVAYGGYMTNPVFRKILHEMNWL